MTLRYVSLIAIITISAALLIELGGDERLQEPVNGVLNLVAQVRAHESRGETTAGGMRVVRGPARVVDGATLEFLDPAIIVHLAGIEVCGWQQPAYYHGTPWPCGSVATAWLVSQTLGKTVECEIQLRRHDGEAVGRCGVNGADIAAEAIVNGHAVVSDDVGGVPITIYRELEDRARAAKKGLWSSIFTRPQEWRDGHLRDLSSQIRQIPGSVTEPARNGQER